ncbi:LacI family transcriptional regulator [Nonomuraea deserti]|uniref:LacI family transcriptional regulator n=1 Tax=Nonomuraea deserti TaxID=1848322 RepID=A0A4V2YB17_9ACTN|nr:LacI family DNA-binding transcriptional regulator [Nonomuraea deserti]TDD05836.1 LacI family transcriptional regulator [Nonomuraea deserti]
MAQSPAPGDRRAANGRTGGPASQRARPVTSYDVAALAGVAQPTVSRALRGGSVSEETRSRVLAAAERLGYVPRDAGRSLATRRTHRIGLVVADLRNFFYLGVLTAFEQRLAEAGFQVTLFREADDATLLARLSSGGIDGVALTSLTLHSSLPRELRERGIPTVLLNRETAHPDVDACVSDNIRGSRMVAERLVELGHRRIGAIFGPADTSTGRDRARGFHDALAEAGVALHPAACREVPYTHVAGHSALAEILDSPPTPTAVFCANDVLAIGALNAAKARGVDVPRDLTVIGYDDMDMSSWEIIDLTTVHQNIDTMARTAAELLVSRVEGGDEELRRVVVPPQLVIRSTDAPVRAG